MIAEFRFLMVDLECGRKRSATPLSGRKERCRPMVSTAFQKSTTGFRGTGL